MLQNLRHCFGVKCLAVENLVFAFYCGASCSAIFSHAWVIISGSFTYLWKYDLLLNCGLKVRKNNFGQNWRDVQTKNVVTPKCFLLWGSNKSKAGYVRNESSTLKTWCFSICVWYLKDIKWNILVLVNGVWSAWSEWKCDCIYKKLYRHRQCDNPPPVNRGTDCEGSAYDYQIDVGICDPSCPGTLTGFKA